MMWISKFYLLVSFLLVCCRPANSDEGTASGREGPVLVVAQAPSVSVKSNKNKRN